MLARLAKLRRAAAARPGARPGWAGGWSRINVGDRAAGGRRHLAATPAACCAQLADEQGKARVQLGGADRARGPAAHRRGRADATARALADRPHAAAPAAPRASTEALPPFLRRSCETGNVDACAVLSTADRGRAVAGAAARLAADRHRQRRAGRALPGAAGHRARRRCSARIAARDATRRSAASIVVRLLDDKLAQRSERAAPALQITLIDYRTFTDARRSTPSRRCTARGLADGHSAVQRIEPLDLYAASFPVFASTRRGHRADRGAPARRRDRHVRRRLIQQAADHRAGAGGARGARRRAAGRARRRRRCAALTEAAVRLGAGRLLRPRFRSAAPPRSARWRAPWRTCAAIWSSSPARCAGARPRRRRVLGRHRRGRVRRRSRPQHPLSESRRPRRLLGVRAAGERSAASAAMC